MQKSGKDERIAAMHVAVSDELFLADLTEMMEDFRLLILNDDTLYYGDNLKILRDKNYFPDEFVDLCYLDPPFNSNRNYNVLFKTNRARKPRRRLRLLKIRGTETKPPSAPITIYYAVGRRFPNGRSLSLVHRHKSDDRLI
jgi:hypothetical protein